MQVRARSLVGAVTALVTCVASTVAIFGLPVGVAPEGFFEALFLNRIHERLDAMRESPLHDEECTRPTAQIQHRATEGFSICQSLPVDSEYEIARQYARSRCTAVRSHSGHHEDPALELELEAQQLVGKLSDEVGWEFFRAQ